MCSEYMLSTYPFSSSSIPAIVVPPGEQTKKMTSETALVKAIHDVIVLQRIKSYLGPSELQGLILWLAPSLQHL